MINRQLNKLLSLLVITVILVSCGHNKAYYYEFRELSKEGWAVNDLCKYETELNDTTQAYNIYIDVRHQGNYPYQNLWLFVSRMSPDSTIVNDTIACDLADYSGKWLGKGSGSVYLFSVPYTQFDVKASGKYVFGIRHGMRNEILKGISAIGLRIELQHGEE